jgi:myo-inositol-hexaphosphate 3-phosphohydrolase
MSTPIYKSLILAAMFLLASCEDRTKENTTLAAAEQEAAQTAANDGKIECAVSKAIDFTRSCQTERIAGNGEKLLVIRHPDGGFRRFKILDNGKGLIAADGFDKVSIKILDDGLIEVETGGDRYQLPAMVKISEVPVPNAAIPETADAAESPATAATK